MKKIIITLIGLALSAMAFAETYSVKSPDGKIEAKISDGKSISISVVADGKNVLGLKDIALKTNKGFLGNGTVKSIAKKQIDKQIDTVYGIRSKVRDNCNLVHLSFDKFALEVRAYNDAVAYRLISNLGDGEMIIEDESLEIDAKKDDSIIAHIVKSDTTSFESTYKRISVAQLANFHNATPPLLLKKDGYTIAMAESSVESFPGMRIVYKDGLKISHSKYPKTLKVRSRLNKVEATENFIAKTKATRAFPWRAFVIARSEKELADCDIVFKLAPKCAVADTKWIKPGLCAWEWWNDWNLEGFSNAGINLETYYYYVDFAAKYNLPYLLVDEGWVYGHHGDKKVSHDKVDENLVEGKTTFDVPALIKYAHSKNVKVVLWVLAKTLEKYGDAAMDKMKSWGADGVKVDFFDRDDQIYVDLYKKIARLAAERQMIVDFHGCQPPAGLQREYPNVLNFEAVLGGECNKWSKVITPEHCIDIVYTRMLLGPMDFTPGAVNNASKQAFKPSYRNPMSQGTRAFQAAMYVVYYGPLQMLCDSPTEYYKNPKTTEFFSKMPTTWDDTKVISGEIGKSVVLARKSGKTWYIAGMNAGDAKEVEIDLAKIFDNNSNVQLEIFADVAETAKDANLHSITKVEKKASDKIKVKMERDGGFVIKATPKTTLFGVSLF